MILTRSRLASGVLTSEAPRPIRLRSRAGRVKFSAERGCGVPQHLDLSPDLAWLLGFYCAEGSIARNRNRPNMLALGAKKYVSASMSVSSGRPAVIIGGECCGHDGRGSRT